MDKFSNVNRRLFDEATRVVLQSVDVLEKNWTVKRCRENQKKGCTLARLMHHQMHGCWSIRDGRMPLLTMQYFGVK